MEMASCTGASLGRSICREQSRGLLCRAQPLRLLQASSNPSKLISLCRCAVESNPASRNKRRTSLECSSRQVLPNLNSFIRTGKSVCCTVDGNSSSSGSSTTTDADPPPSSANKDQEEDIVAEYEEPDRVGKALSQIRQERLVSGQESPSKTEEFWRGVLEEIRLIEWPSLQKVLGTTGVVTSIIVGSSLVLLTVNALLAQLSDAIFNTPPPA